MVDALRWQNANKPAPSWGLQDPRAGKGTDWEGRNRLLGELRDQRRLMGQLTPEDRFEMALEAGERRADEAEARAQRAETRLAEFLETQRQVVEDQKCARDTVVVSRGWWKLVEVA